MVDGRQVIRIARRMAEATGYLELGMAQHALDRLENLGDLGPFEAEVSLLRGEAFRIQHRYEDAARSLTTAATKFPPPFNRPIWLALSRYYRQTGDTHRAIQMLGHARGAAPPTKRPKRK